MRAEKGLDPLIHVVTQAVCLLCTLPWDKQWQTVSCMCKQSRTLCMGTHRLPHRTKDPVVAAAALVGALQSLVSRETSPTDGAVVSVSRFNTGALLCSIRGRPPAE